MKTMEKIKPLLSSLREKKRYVAFEIVSEKQLSFKQASELILESCLNFLGIKGLADMGLIILKEKYKANKGVIRVCAGFLDKLRASFCLAKNIGSEPVVLRSLGVSGVLKKMDRFLAS